MNDLKRLSDLANQAYRNNIFTFTNFLSEAELSDFLQNEKDFRQVGYKLFGGYDDADRVMIRFNTENELGYEVPWPINILMIKPLSDKFSEDLTHRDFLGALMNLGIERERLGDILIENNTGYLFVSDSLCDFIITNLLRIRHTPVAISVIDTLDKSFERKYVEKHLQVSSERIDGIVAKFSNLSRSKCAEYFHDRKVFVNGRLMENHSHILSTGDKVSVRGYGKFIYDGISRKTRSDNLIINIRVYS